MKFFRFLVVFSSILFTNNLAIAAPDAAALISPNGSIIDDTPTYQWYALSDVSYYFLRVTDSSGVVVQQWYTAADAGCSGGTGTCQVDQGTTLASGSGQWQIITYGTGGYGPLNPDGMTFSLTTQTTPSEAELNSPSGTISDSTPSYQWNAVSSAGWYFLRVVDSTGDAVIQEWYTSAQAGCASGSGTCTVVPSTELADGDAVWQVVTWNTNGYGTRFPESCCKTFKVTATATPVGSFSDYTFPANTGVFYASADIDGNGFLDIITQDRTLGKMYFFVNDGSTLTLNNTINVPTYLVTPKKHNHNYDFDNDGTKDLLVYGTNSSNCGSNNVRIYWGSSSAPYFSENEYTSLNLSNPFCVNATGIDFNADGLMDIFIDNVEFSGSRPELSYKNNGNRSFVSVTTTETPRDLTHEPGDLDGDGKKDLISAKSGWADRLWGVYYYRGKGDGTFESPIINYASERATYHLVLQADPTNDSIQDVAFKATNDGGNTLYIGTWNAGNFQFGTYSINLNGLTNVLLQSIDYNGDNNEDIIVRYSQGSSLFTLQAFINDGSGGFGTNTTIATDLPLPYELRDMDNDGDLELIARDSGDIVVRNIP